MAKNTESPIILLSQLNRNIDNRGNKRPLLSDLRESGCISCMNKPSIQVKGHSYLWLKTIQWLAQSYGSQTEADAKLDINTIQYTYYTLHYQELELCATHNHKILTDQGWRKIDQLKRKNQSMANFSKIIDDNIRVRRTIMQNIELLKKENVYDIAAYEYSNFLINKYIIHNSIEQDADLILMLYQDSENSSDDRIDIIIAKHRNGPAGSFQLLFHADICKFTDIQRNQGYD